MPKSSTKQISGEVALTRYPYYRVPEVACPELINFTSTNKNVMSNKSKITAGPAEPTVIAVAL
jgi:hypothetical protein